MRVLYCHPTREAGERACVAFVDFEINENLRLYGIRLIRQPDGRHTLSAPQCGKRQSATFGRHLAERLTSLAVAALDAAR